jgi:two-component sensor histidine kinase
MNMPQEPGKGIFGKVSLDGKPSSRITQLLNLIREMNRCDGYEDTLAAAGKAARVLMEAEDSFLWLMEEESNRLFLKYNTQWTASESVVTYIDRGQSYSGWVAAHKLPLYVNHINGERDKRHIFNSSDSADASVMENIICAPLLDEDNEVTGVIEAVNCYTPPELTDDDLPVFQAFANHAAAAIERVESYGQEHGLGIEKDLYLTEIHHRIKNDLALISGIVEIESFELENEKAKDVLLNIQSRIKSIATVYELLSGGGSRERAQVQVYLKKLTQGISESLSKRNTNIEINLNADPVMLDSYQTLSCGLIVNELILNSYKHAFKDKASGSIDIRLKKGCKEATIDYHDNGPGLPADFEIGEQDSIGLDMIRTLVEQLRGTIEVIEDKGAHFFIQFKIGDNDDADAAASLGEQCM